MTQLSLHCNMNSAVHFLYCADLKIQYIFSITLFCKSSKREQSTCSVTGKRLVREEHALQTQPTRRKRRVTGSGTMLCLYPREALLPHQSGEEVEDLHLGWHSCPHAGSVDKLDKKVVTSTPMVALETSCL